MFHNAHGDERKEESKQSEAKILAALSSSPERKREDLTRVDFESKEEKESDDLEAQSDFDVDPAFICPIDHDIMQDPVIASDGISYERAAIEAWFVNHNTSPMTNLPLADKTLRQNINLRQAIQKFVSDRIVFQREFTLKKNLLRSIQRREEELKRLVEECRGRSEMLRTTLIREQQHKANLLRRVAISKVAVVNELGIDEEGWTLSHQYVWKNKLGELKEHYAKRSVEDNKREVVQENVRGWRPLDIALIFADADMVNFLLAMGAASVVNVRNKKGMLPIHLACQYGDEDTLQLLLDSGAEKTINEEAFYKNFIEKALDLNTHGGITPLWLATYFGCSNMMKILLARGAKATINMYGDLFFVDKSSLGSRIPTYTPLQMATRFGTVDKCRLLLEYGADPALKEKILFWRAGSSLEELATRNPAKEEILALLKDFKSSGTVERRLASSEHESKESKSTFRPA